MTKEEWLNVDISLCFKAFVVFFQETLETIVKNALSSKNAMDSAQARLSISNHYRLTTLTV